MADKESSKQALVNSRPKSGAWNNDEKEQLLDWLSSNIASYSGLKTNEKSTYLKISTEVFGKMRTADAVKSQWETMKKKYQATRDRLQSTRKGQRSVDGGDPEKWKSTKLNWLNEVCPYFDLVDDVLKRDGAI